MLLGAAAYEKSEDPIYVLENNIPIDTKYYLENQLSNPLMRIFEPVLGDKAQSLLAGDHTRTIQIATPTVGGLMKFAVKTATCLGCKTPLKSSNSIKGESPLVLTSSKCLSRHEDGAVCNNCRPRIGELYQKQVCFCISCYYSRHKLMTSVIGLLCVGNASSLLQTVDTVPTVSRLIASRCSLLK